MRTLKDEHLVDCYLQAIEWNLDEEFIEMLRDEIDTRRLDVELFGMTRTAVAIS